MWGIPFGGQEIPITDLLVHPLDSVPAPGLRPEARISALPWLAVRTVAKERKKTAIIAANSPGW